VTEPEERANHADELDLEVETVADLEADPSEAGDVQGGSPT